MESLVNKGVSVLNANILDPDNSKTVIVLGSGRGGTSIAAGVLYHLGIEMFDAKAPVFEDVKIAKLFSSPFATKKSLSELNKTPVWGFKRPSAIRHIRRINRITRHPYYICIFRDPFAIANRNEISMGAGYTILSSVRKALATYRKVTRFIKNCKRPVLLCSCEKVKMYPADFVDSVCQFLKYEPTEEQYNNAVAFITDEPAHYLISSREQRSIGRVAAVKNGKVEGWCFWVGKNQHAVLDIYRNGELVHTLEANLLSPGKEKNPNSNNGYCGFSFDLSDLNAKPGDTLAIQVQDDVVPLGEPVLLTEKHF